MAETSPFNLQAFSPYAGGQGKKIAATSTSATYAVPGLPGGEQTDRSRVFVYNDGYASVCIRLGQAGVVATLDSLRVPPGIGFIIRPALATNSAVYIAAITEADTTTTLAVCAGEGTL